MVDVKIEPGSTIAIDHVAPITIRQAQKIAPIAAHIKEVNHIDPISIDALHVSEVRNIEPISIDTFNVTNLPMINMSLRQLPPVDMNVRRLPPVSIGTHQDFTLPSNYTVRARFLGIEFFRIHLDGHTMVVPKERYRREQARSHSRSFPETATAGNPAIPSVCRETDTRIPYPSQGSHPPQSRCSHHRQRPIGPQIPRKMRPARAGGDRGRRFKQYEKSSMSFGFPGVSFGISGATISGTYGHSSVSSGD